MSFFKNLRFRLRLKRAPRLADAKTKKFIANHNRHDELLVQNLSRQKKPTLKQVKYINKLFTVKEKLILKSLILVIMVGLIFVGANSYFLYTTEQPRVGGEYTEGLLGSPQYINPILSQTNDVDLDLTALIFNGLLRYDSQGGLVNDLATEFNLDEEQKVYTIKIRDDVYWHDGEKLTAEDVFFTFEKIQDVNTKSPLYFNFKGVTIEKIDDLTIKFTLETPFAPFKESLTVGIVPAHIWNGIPAQNFNLSEYNLKPIGSGPYEFNSFVKDNKTTRIKSYSLKRNNNYFDGNSFIEKLNFKFYSSLNEAITAFNNKHVEGLAFLPKNNQNDILNAHAINFHSISYPQYTAMFFNQKENSLLKDTNIRKALAQAINKAEIISQVLGGQAQKIDSALLPGSLGYTDEFTKYELDLENAKKILEDNNWQLAEYIIEPQETEKNDDINEESNDNEQEKNEESSSDENNENNTQEEIETIETYPFKVRKKNNNYLEFTLTTVEQDENIEIAQIIQKDLQQVGIKLNLKFYSAEEINREVLKPRNYEILLYGAIIGYDPDPYAFWHSSQINHPGLNLSLFSNKEVDTLLEEARKTSDEEKRAEKYTKFQQIIAEQIPAVFLFNPTYIYPQSKKIKDFSANTIIVPANRFSNITQWYIKTKRTFN